jgi:hypothetical protein
VVPLVLRCGAKTRQTSPVGSRARPGKAVLQKWKSLESKKLTIFFCKSQLLEIEHALQPFHDRLQEVFVLLDFRCNVVTHAIAAEITFTFEIVLTSRIIVLLGLP